MANLKAIRTRIGSVGNTQKITRAMKMVAAARLRKAQESTESFRAYAQLTSSVLAEVASGASQDEHPLLERREPKKSLTLVICSDRGLCGGFNSNLCREVFKKEQAAENDSSISIIGRRAVDYYKRRDVNIDATYLEVYDDPSYATAAKIARELADRYAKGEIDEIKLAYNEFVSVISQKPKFKQLLPVVPPKRDEGDTSMSGGFLFEPERAQLLGSLLPRYVEVQVYHALIESIAAEHAARMTAMDAATNNAGEMIDHLTLVYNRARQSAITGELIEIVSGAEALND